MDSDTTEMTKIYLARHGQDEDNASGILNGHRNRPLTEIGVTQAHALSEKVKTAGLRFDAIYSSPLQRASRTAEIVVGGLVGGAVAGTGKGTEVIRIDDLIERDFGIMTGTLTSEISERCSGPDDTLATDTVTYFLRPEGGETFPDLLIRADGVIRRVLECHPAGGSSSVLLVTHGDFGKMLYAAFYKLEWRDVLRQFHFGNSELLLLSEDSSPEGAHLFNIQQHNV